MALENALTLVAFPGTADPFVPGFVPGAEMLGPVLVRATSGSFRRIILVRAQGHENTVAQTATALRERLPGADIAIAEADDPMLDDREGVEVLDPTDLSDLTDPSDSAIRPAKGQPSTPLMVREPRVRYGTACSAPETDQVARRIGIRGEHPAVRAALDTAAALATHPVPVLIEGETGTGKSLVARLVHELSGRAGGPFVQVNCGALPEKLVESTLFGHRKGAFTGATDDHAGKFAAADGGTLFLDEVGELPLELQPKLLKVLEDGMVEPVGAAKGYAVDVRVIAATNRDLKAMVAGRTFREDLYYRLSFGIIRLPPLRERRTDIRPLALHALARVNRTLRTPKQLSPEAIERLEQQEWRGNVRDLENVIGRSALLARADVLDAADLVIEDPVRADDPLSMLPTPNESFSLEGFLDSARKQLILRALDIAGGSQAGAARLLGVTPQAVHKFLNPR